MSSKKKSFLTVLVVLLVVCMFTACANLRGAADNTQSNGGYQDAELMDRIAHDYEDYCYQQWGVCSSFKVEYCYGVYNECVFVMLDGEKIATSHAERNVDVGGVMFHYRDGSSIEVWKEGEFYTLEEAYDKGLVTIEYLQELAEIHNNERYGEQKD